MTSSKPSIKNKTSVIPNGVRNLKISKKKSRDPSPAKPDQDDNKPKQYQLGWVEFYKLKFKVTPDVLIPRPETELLVEEVLGFVNSLFVVRKSLDLNEKRMTKNDITIIDLGTGSCNIAISIAKNLNLHPIRGLIAQEGVNVSIIATDISPKALNIARQNARLHRVENRIIFLQSNLLSAFCHSDPALDAGEESLTNVRPTYVGDPSPAKPDQDDNLIIVTNLPYIPSARIPYLDSSVKDYEPHVALDGGKDGFELYRKLFQQIRSKNWRPQLIIGEIDYTHGELAINEAQKYFPEAQIEVRKDLAHLQRILTIRHY